MNELATIRKFLVHHWLKVVDAADVRVLRLGDRLTLEAACLRMSSNPDTLIPIVANIIRDMFPDRDHSENIGVGIYTDRMTLIDFNNHPLTTLIDVLAVLDTVGNNQA